MKYFYFFITLLISSAIYSQTAIIKGTVIEEASGKSIPGVTIKLLNTKIITQSDASGSFIIRNVSVGKQELEFSDFTLTTKIISDIETTKDETTSLTVSMSEKNNSLNEVVIKRTKMKAESVASLLSVQKNSSRVSDGISAESIKRTPDKTTSDVLKRISGASVQDNKFVIIRGLNDRYNTTYLNGAPLPSTEPDRKAFSFDIFPANMIDNLVIYKTATPDLPGEFAGGVIEINTKATPDKNFESFSIGSGYNTLTTGKKQLYSAGGKTEWIGLDDGTRALPASFPSVQNFQALQGQRTQSSILEIASLAKSYQSDWRLYEKKFSPNTSLQYTLGRFYKLNDDKSIGLLASVTYNKTNNYNETNSRRYEAPGQLQKNLLDQNYRVQTLFSTIGNLSFKLNANNSFSLKNLYSINSESKILDRNGSLNQESDPLWINTTSRIFTNNKIYSGQLSGEHFLQASKIKVNWVGSYSNVNREIPSERRNSYRYFKFDDGTVSQPKADFSTNNAIGPEYPGSIFTSENKEYIVSAKLDLSKKIKISDDFTTEIKAGGIVQSRFRDFAARQLGYVQFNGLINGVTFGSNTFLQSISNQPNETIFNASNMGILGANSSGLTLYDGTKGNDTYSANSKLATGYLMFDNLYKKLRIVWGARLENYSQKLDSKEDNGDLVTVNDSQLDILPSINFIYNLTKNQNLRLSASKTLNRPEFRELAPFLFYDTATEFNTYGDPTLKIAEIVNADLRYEVYPGKGQLFSISAFYKNFTNPIELQARANNSNQYKNAKSGSNKGMEVEYRTLLSSIFGTENTKILEDLTLYTNLAVIRSKVDISNLVTSSTLKNIPLQGQSPYVFNSGLQYMNKEFGWSGSVNVNRIGNRIAIHGNQTPGGDTNAYWEKGRTFLDLQIAKNFLNNKLELKLNVQNALAQDLIFYQNNDSSTNSVSGIKGIFNSILTGDSQDKNGYNHKEDDLVWRTKFGPTVSMSINYSF